MESLINIGLWITYFLIGVATLGMLAGVVMGMIQTWQSGGKFTVIGVIAIVVLFIIGYALSSDQISSNLANKGFNDPTTYRLAGAGLFTFYGLAVIATILLVIDIVKGFID